MRNRHRNRYSSYYTNYMIGGMLICIGAAFLLDQQGIVALENSWQYWPLVLVVGGAIRVIDPETPRDITSGCWTLLVGVWLLANFEGWFGINFGNSWPFLLIGWGASLLLRPILQARLRGGSTDTDAAARENGNAR